MLRTLALLILAAVGCGDATTAALDGGSPDAAPLDAPPSPPLTPGYVPYRPSWLPMRWAREMAPLPSRPCGAREREAVGSFGEMRFTYDDNGFPASILTGATPALPATSHTLRYDAGGHLVYSRYDDFLTFEADHDDAGQLVALGEDFDDDGEPDQRRVVVARDPRGRPERVQQTAPGMTGVLTYEYGEHGRVAVEAYDVPEDGAVDWSIRCEHDDAAFVRTCTYHDAEGRPVGRNEAVYRPDLQLVSHTEWVAGEAAPSFATSNGYDASGQLATSTFGPEPVTLEYLYSCP